MQRRTCHSPLSDAEIKARLGNRWIHASRVSGSSDKWWLFDRRRNAFTSNQPVSRSFVLRYLDALERVVVSAAA